MWLIDLVKTLWAGYKARSAAKAASELPQGAAAITAIDADGKTIEAQLSTTKATAR